MGFLPCDEEVRKIAEFILVEDVKRRIPAILVVTYLVVLLNVFVSTCMGFAFTEVIGYNLGRRQVIDFCIESDREVENTEREREVEMERESEGEGERKRK